jgi:hypothetical protein
LEGCKRTVPVVVTVARPPPTAALQLSSAKTSRLPTANASAVPMASHFLLTSTARIFSSATSTDPSATVRRKSMLLSVNVPRKKKLLFSSNEGGWPAWASVPETATVWPVGPVEISTTRISETSGVSGRNSTALSPTTTYSLLRWTRSSRLPAMLGWKSVLTSGCHATAMAISIPATGSVVPVRMAALKSTMSEAESTVSARYGLLTSSGASAAVFHSPV